MNPNNQNFFSYQSLGNYIPRTKIPIVSAVKSGMMIIPSFAGFDAQAYSNPDYNTLMGVSGNNYDSISQAYQKHCHMGNCVKYDTVRNPCNTIPPSVSSDRNSRI